MKFAKLILLFILFQTFSGNAKAQVEDQSATTYLNIEKYRQLFWDSLPKPVSWTNDFAQVYSTRERKSLDSIITDFEKETTMEICIVTLDTFCTSKERFEDLTLHILDSWGVGKKGINNGIVICISPGYRKIRIDTGTGIEKYLTDAEIKYIIDQNFIPEFKNADFYKGTLEGLQALISKLNDKLKVSF